MKRLIDLIKGITKQKKSEVSERNLSDNANSPTQGRVGGETNIGIVTSELRWFFRNKKISGITKTMLDLHQHFRDTFPVTSKLLDLSKVTECQIDDCLYRLYEWRTKNGNSCGWVCRIEVEIPNLELINEHLLLLKYIGGIEESWDQYDETEIKSPFTLNQNFMFIGAKCSRGMGLNKKAYLEECRRQNLEPLKMLDDLIVFAKEANGNLTFYDSNDGEVYLYAHDHNFNYVESIIGQPDYSFYRITGCSSFIEYVEKLSSDWLEVVD